MLLCLAVLVRLKLGAPVLFRQTRPGLHGRPFSILKFRTMTDARDALGNLLPDGERLTRFGRFLRSTSLDELPELFNVLRGEMSLVGPRPEMPFITRKYTALERQRLKVKPGITGLWQVYARSENLPIHHHIEYDLFYIENMSVLLDLIIIIDTLPTAIMRTGI